MFGCVGSRCGSETGSRIVGGTGGGGGTWAAIRAAQAAATVTMTMNPSSLVRPMTGS